MRYVEVRRHSIRNDSGELIPAGIELARRLGKEIGPFKRVITSPITRAYETAVAMGFKVDERDARLGIPGGAIGSKFGNEVAWANTFADFADAVRKKGAAAEIGEMLAQMWRSVAMSLADGEQALLITHSMNIEVGAVVCLPDADHRSWGVLCASCEGARLGFDGEKFISAEILRVR
jgi:broad specificity phosphatase PhoE